MKILNILGIICLPFLFSGCVTTLSLEGSNVQIIELTQRAKYKCSRIGFVNSFDTSGLTVGSEKQNAITELLNKAANAKANAIVVQSESTTLMGTGITAEALDCKNLPSLVE